LAFFLELIKISNSSQGLAGAKSGYKKKLLVETLYWLYWQKSRIMPLRLVENLSWFIKAECGYLSTTGC